MWKRMSFAAISLSLLVGLAPRSVEAQAVHEGKVTGTVTSKDGVALPGASVVISSPALLAGERTATTDRKSVV